MFFLKQAANYRWGSLMAGTLMLLCLGLLYAWSIFRIPLMEMFISWTATQASAVFTFSMSSFCLGIFFCGLLVKRISYRAAVVVAAALLFAGFFCASFIDAAYPQESLYLMLVFYGIFCGVGIGISYNAIVSAVILQFPERAGFASGILMMGFGFGGLILGSVVTGLLAFYSLNTVFRFLAALIFCVNLIGSFFIKSGGAETESASSGEAVKMRSYTTAEMLRTVEFWCYFVWGTMFTSAELLMINSVALIAVAFGLPAIIGMIISAFNGAGRLGFGVLLDRLGVGKAITAQSVMMLSAGVSLLAGALTRQTAFILFGIVLTGLSYGGSAPTSATAILKWFGPGHYSVNFSIATMTLIPASILGPLISGELQQRSDGDYTTTFIAMICFLVVALVCNLILLKKRPN